MNTVISTYSYCCCGKVSAIPLTNSCNLWVTGWVEEKVMGEVIIVVFLLISQPININSRLRSTHTNLKAEDGVTIVAVIYMASHTCHNHNYVALK